MTLRAAMPLSVAGCFALVVAAGCGDEAKRKTETADTFGFYLGMHEVTQADYQRVMGTNPSYFSRDGRYEDAVTGQDTSRFPVENVSWDDAKEFCRKLSALDTERRTGRSYGLPTEAQWEYACRAGTTTAFHFGDVSNGRQANVDGNRPFGTTQKAAEVARPTPVGAYNANAFGLFDMHGNVWEWCEDYYDENFYEKRLTADPLNDTETKSPVLRSGSYFEGARDSRPASRNGQSPDFRIWFMGFRVVCSVEP